MKETPQKKRFYGERLLVASVWVVLGIFSAGVLGLRALLLGKPTMPELGIWYDYVFLVTGVGMILVGVGYYFCPRIRDYLDAEAEHLDTPSGRRTLSLLYILRIFRKR